MARGCTPQEYVDALLIVYRKFTNIVSNYLSNDQNFTDALNRAMTKMVNSTGDTKKYPRSSELVSIFLCDSIKSAVFGKGSQSSTNLEERKLYFFASD